MKEALDKLARMIFNPSKTIPTGQLLIRDAPKQRVQGKRYERRTTGISARNQRRRRREAVFPPVLGTRRGLRRYLSTLRRSVRLRGECLPDATRAQLGARRGICDQVPNRAQRRWLERWWAAEEAL